MNFSALKTQHEPAPSRQLRAAYDVFNGDADGICALHQIRLAFPRDAVLVTGVKRDIALLEKIPAQENCDVAIFDISLDVNVEHLRRLLNAGAHVLYFDHHSANRAFPHPRLHLRWDGAPDVCSSILVDRYLGGRFRSWTVAAAFGDNLVEPARRLAISAGIDRVRVDALAELGLLLNYNAYGERVDDLHVAPEALYHAIHAYVDPFDFINDSPYYRLLAEGYKSDASLIGKLKPSRVTPGGEIYVLPCTAWARRISGTFANMLAARVDAKSFAVMTESSDCTYTVSVRSGQPAQRAANQFCQRFPTGGGRAAAAGINALPMSELDAFFKEFGEYFGAAGTASGVTHAH